MSGFGGFTTGNGRDFLEAALHTYDAVIGYDHRTLTIDPRENAKDLMTRLSVHVTGQPMILDIITHSRGGLTTRSLLEYELPQSNWNGSVDKVVFVASTNGGTRLADPARWIDLIDLTTNLAAAGGTALQSGDQLFFSFSSHGNPGAQRVDDPQDEPEFQTALDPRGAHGSDAGGLRKALVTNVLVGTPTKGGERG